MSNVTTLTNPVIWRFKLALFHIHGIVITQHCTSIIPLIEIFSPVHFSPKSRFDQPAWKISPSMIGKRIASAEPAGDLCDSIDAINTQELLDIHDHKRPAQGLS